MPEPTAVDALLEAAGRGARLWVDGGQLRFRAPPGALDDALRAALTDHRDVLIGALPGPEHAEDGWHPLSGTQQGIWFFQRLAPDCPAYHLPFAATVEGPFEPQALAGRLRGAVVRHEILRTTLPTLDGRPLQRVRSEAPPQIAVEDATGWSPQAIEAALRRDVEAPFDLSEGPLVRLRILRLAPRRHVVALCLHHAIADLSSMSLLLHELIEGTGDPPSDPYGAFARQQRAWLDGPGSEPAWAHWQERLDGADWDLALPVDSRPAGGPGHRGGTHRFVLPAALAARLEGVAAEREVTLNALLLTSWGILLRAYCGQDDLLVGSPVSGRFERRFGRTLGPFVDVLPLRLRLPWERPFSELLSAGQEEVAQALGHAELPFAALIRRLAPPRDPQRTATLRTLFAWQSLAPGTPAAHRELVAGEPVELGGAVWTPLILETGAVDFDLAATASRSRVGISVAMEYRSALFEGDTIRRMARSWRGMLEDVAEGREAPRSVIPSERARLLGPLARGPGRSIAAPGSVLERFTARALAAPRGLACLGRGGPITYGELAARASALAPTLPPGESIGLLAAPGPEQLVGLLAILGAGGAFVPLAEGDPAPRQRAMLDDAEVGTVVSSPGLRGPAEALGRTVIAVGGDAEVGTVVSSPGLRGPPEALGRTVSDDETTSPGPPPRRPSGPEDRVYVAFTSGSTGRPKGVPITEANLAPVLSWGIEELGLGPGTRVLQNLSIAFDFGIFEVLTALVSGATLCVPERGASLDEILDFAGQHRIDTLHTTPSWARLLLSAGRPLPTLRTVHFGGEVLPRDLVERLLLAMHPDGRVVNGYGPTEATINCTVARFDRRSAGALADAPSVPIGVPVAPFRLYVLDGRGEPSPLGGRGELHIGGPCVASGYLGRPDDPAFLDDPFEPGGRLYRTGDLARMMPTGTLLFCGRRDRQVQLRGRRVELEEVEAALLLHPGVARCAADVRPGPGGERLVVWVVERKPPPTPTELRAHLARLLPPAMRPARFVPTPDLPSNRAGKLDRAALREPPLGELEAPGGPQDAARDALEADVLAIFREILREPTLGAHAGFFELGDSLLAVELAHRLGRRLGREVSGDAVFHAPTAAALAASLREPAASGLLAFRADGASPPLFILPPGDFELPALRHLAELLPPERPVFALRPDDAPSLPELLRRYADAIAAQQPAGPLHLLGYCVGGQIAFALAGALEARGRDVALVVLVDSPFRESRWGGLAFRGARRLVRRWGPRGRSRLARHARGLFLDPGVDAHARVLLGHEPRPWGGRVVYLMARRSPLRLTPTRRRWRGVTSASMDFGWLPGDHDSVINEPHVRILADRLTALLD